MAWNIGNDENIEIIVEMVGARQVAAEANLAATSVERLGLASKTAGVEMEHAGRRSFLMQQTIFTMRRVAYSGTIALAALGAGAVYMGLKFDASMEQNRISMTQFLGSTKAADAELRSLFQLAATTPFDFAGVTEAAKHFLAYGFSAREVNKDLRTIADTSAGLGGGTDTINRIILAFGQMQAKGRVMGQEMLQLNEVGINAQKILQDQLHLTDAQIQQIGRTGIKASIAIPALIRGLDQRYGGLSAKQAKTLLGQLSTLRDYTVQTLGVVMKPLFNTLEKDILPVAVQIATTIQAGFGEGGLLGSLKAIQASNAPLWFKLLYNDLYELIQFINGPLRSGLGPVIVTFLYFVGAILYAIGPILHLINTIDHFHHVIGLLITAFVVYKITGMALAVVNSELAWTFMSKLLLAVEYVTAGIVWLWNRMLYGAVIEGVVMTETEALTVVYGEQAVATEALAIAQWELNAAMLANPITWIILAVILLVAAFVLLYLKVKWFHDFINDHWRLLLVLLTGPIGLAIVILVNHFNDLKGYITSLFNWIGQKADWLANKIQSIPGFGYLKAGFDAAAGFAGNVESNLAHLADGGIVRQGGLSWVGERGPELMWLPPSAQVAPLDHIGSMVGGNGAGFTSHTTLVLDRKVVGEASAKYQLDREARN